jgi:glycogen debranching enzyme
MTCSLLTDARGDIERDHRGLGLYAGDTRFLSLYELRVNGVRPVVLRTGNAVGYHSTLQLTNPDLVERTADMDGSEIVLRRHSLGVVRERLVADGFAELIAIDNFTMDPERARCTIRIDADYADIFEIRGLVRAKRGERLANEGDAGHLVLGYRGLDGVVRKTHVTFSAPLKLLDAHTQVTARGDLRTEGDSATEVGAVPETGPVLLVADWTLPASGHVELQIHVWTET